MPARGGDLQRALGDRLPLDIGEVNGRALRRGLPMVRGDRRLGLPFRIQPLDHPTKIEKREERNAGHTGDFLHIAEWQNKRRPGRAGETSGQRERPPDRTDGAVQREFPEPKAPRPPFGGDRFARHQNPDGDGQVKAGALLP